MSSTEVSNAVLVEVGPGEDTKPSDISEVTEVSEEPQDVDMKRRHALSKLQFPVKMKVLAVDDDQTCLRILETLLHHCHYHGLLSLSLSLSLSYQTLSLRLELKMK
ncbi:hypothetical protein F2Q68_00043950 [Brassica cretica]|uniref:Response regulatory domain-containing protein n=1 Tax=Brassica cretica TaxID=69181 RepID=A0A8S9LR19_BRACR|nr:hypothetical protein F2Q68_00043950 [Brassica cretica]